MSNLDMPQPRTDQDGFDRVPPQDRDAEQSVLGGMLLSKDAITEVIETLEGKDFYVPAHETIFHAILDLFAKGEPADPITIAAELLSRGDLARVGGASYLHTLVQSVPTAANASYYAEIVHDRAKLRRLVEAGTRITQMGYAAHGDVDEILDAAGAALHNAVQVREDSSTVRLGDRYSAYIDRLEDRQKNGTATGVLTGLADLDALTKGLHAGQMIVIAARPALGKSTLAIDFARSAAIKQKLRTVVFSLEMGEDELAARITSAEAQVALHHLTGADPTPRHGRRSPRRRPGSPTHRCTSTARRTSP